MHSRFKYSLRSFVIAVGFASAFLGLGGAFIRWYYIEREAGNHELSMVEDLKSRGIDCIYTDFSPPYSIYPRRPGSIYLVFWKSRTTVDGADLDVVLGINTLTNLFVTHCKLSDDDIEKISQSESITRLEMSFTNANDQWCNDLASMQQLEDLQLNFTGLTIDGLRTLVGNKKLKNISVVGCSIPERDIEKLRASHSSISIDD